MNAKFYPVNINISSIVQNLNDGISLGSGINALPAAVRSPLTAPSLGLAVTALSPPRLREVFANEASVHLTSMLINNQKPAPTTLNELESEDIFTSVLSVDIAMKLGIPLGTGSSSFARRVFIQEYAKYSDISEGEGKVRWGVAVRWINDIKILKAEANISSLPILSASAQLGYVEASSRFQVIGITSKIITDLLPASIELTVENYVKLKDAMEQIKKHIGDQDVIVSPKVLSVYSGLNISQDDQYVRAIATAWAVQRIAKGSTLRACLDTYPSASLTSHETIKDVYLDLTKTTDFDIPPDDAAKEKASKLLINIRIKS